MRILIATNNPGKLREFQQLLGDDAEIVSMREAGLASPPETGETFEENAETKARVGAKATGLLTVADDSGIEVDALDSAPGVYSARFSGEGATDERNRILLLGRLKGVPAAERGARFVSVIAVCTAEDTCRTFRGEWEGRVVFEAKGENGFGYDSLFELPDGRTAAQLPPEEKNAQSHRSRALQAALPWLQSLLDRNNANKVKGQS